MAYSKKYSNGWKPIPGEGLSGKDPGRVPGAHQSRPEAQDREGKRAGERASTGRNRGQWGAQRRECTTVQETGMGAETTKAHSIFGEKNTRIGKKIK